MIESVRPHVDYARHLNPQQLDVVLAGEGPLLVIAGAGSGKTRTLTYRVARLVESGVAAERILLLTFTNRAAREMLGRVHHLLGRDVGRILGGTFHHVGHVLLRRWPERAGRKPGFTIIDRDDSKELMKEILGRFHGAEAERGFPKPEVAIDMLSYAVNTLSPPERVLQERFPMFREHEETLLRAFHRYEHRKSEANLVDFDDLLMLCLNLLRGPSDILDALREEFRHVLVDEYQDTNRLQARIVETLAGENGNLMVVGDDAQSIYSFRGANFGNIIDFPKRYPAAKLFKLETNYRSTPEVLDLANSTIRNNRLQFPKTLRAARPSGPRPERVTCGDVAEQARFVADRIEALRGEGVEPADVAILYRAHWHSMEIQMELTRRGVPFQVRSGLRFFEQAHIKDVAAYLKIIANPRDEISWKRVLRLYPKVGPAAAHRVWETVSMSPDPIAALGSDAVRKLVSAPARQGIGELARLVRGLAALGRSVAPAEMIRVVIEGGYGEHLTSSYLNAGARADDVRRLADYGETFADLQSFLGELALAGMENGAGVARGESEGAVQLTTVHQAKGLEWRAVFLVWLAEGKLPDARSSREPGGEEEERRLFYVACTRAMERLFLVRPCLADERRLRGVIQHASIFLDELDPGTYEDYTA
ncbi:MAG: ATP-dependent helicase [Planctomycetes bacterium]|nr:ATP-dependent helicase [Planctomycetota bacterium]